MSRFSGDGSFFHEVDRTQRCGRTMSIPNVDPTAQVLSMFIGHCQEA